MIGCLQTRVRKQTIIALYFESETVLKFYNLEGRSWQMGDQELTDEGSRVDRWGTKSWQMKDQELTDGDQEMADGGPRVDRWGIKCSHMLNWNFKGISWEIKVILFGQKSQSKRWRDYLSWDMRFPTMWSMQPAKAQMCSLIRAVASCLNSLRLLGYWPNSIRGF